MSFPTNADFAAAASRFDNAALNFQGAGRSLGALGNMALSLVLLEHMQDKRHAEQLKEEFLRARDAAERFGVSALPEVRKGGEEMVSGARRRLAAIIRACNERRFNADAATAHDPNAHDLKPYIQTDPRGAALYILRPDDVPAGKVPAAYYSRGICIY